jgi:hypothetical protein
MRYYALATDYDHTLAHDGSVSDQAVAALEKLRRSGRKLILVTGRELPDLLRVFSRVDLFERVVAENGALLYRPATREEKLLGDRPPDEFITALRQRQVAPLAVGQGIVSTWTPHETTVLETIRDLGLVPVGGSKPPVCSSDFSRLTSPKTTKVVTTNCRTIYAAMY